MYAKISSGVHHQNSAGIPAEILALLLSTIQAGIHPDILA